MAKVKIEVKNSVLQDGVHYVTSDYKTRNPKRKDHKGMDLVGKNGLDEIVAIADGIVTISTYSSSAGYYVQIKHNNGYTTRYLHMKKGSIKVKVGDRVVKGQILGYMGNTGKSDGAHLHFDIHNGKDYIDPLPFLQGIADFSTNHYKKFVGEVQAAVGAKVDEIAGPETLSKTITVSAKKNKNHKVVTALERYLKVMGYYKGDIEEDKGNNPIFGSGMTAATKEYQKDFGCVSDGEITAKQKTWKKLLEL